MKRASSKVALVVGLVVVVSGACSSAPREAPARDQRVLGFLGFLTGETSPNPNELVNGVEIAVAEYNANPDSRFEVSIKRVDTLGTPEGAAAGATELRGTELLIGVVGPFTSPEVGAVGPIFESSQIPFVVPTVSDSGIGGWNVFRRLIPNDSVAGTAIGVDVAQRAGTTDVALFHGVEGAGPLIAESAKKSMEEARVTLVRFEAIEESSDLESVASGVVGEGAAFIVHIGPSGRSGAFLRALRAAGFQGRYMASDVVGQGSFAEGVGDAGEGALGTSIYADPADPALGDFNSAHRDQYEKAPVAFAAETYEGALMILEAIEEVEAKPEAIAELLRSAKVFLGDTRKYVFDERGELASSPIWVSEFSGGLWSLIGRSEAGSLPQET